MAKAKEKKTAPKSTDGGSSPTRTESWQDDMSTEAEYLANTALSGTPGYDGTYGSYDEYRAGKYAAHGAVDPALALRAAGVPSVQHAQAVAAGLTSDSIGSTTSPGLGGKTDPWANMDLAGGGIPLAEDDESVGDVATGAAGSSTGGKKGKNVKKSRNQKGQVVKRTWKNGEVVKKTVGGKPVKPGGSKAAPKGGPGGGGKKK